MTFIIRAASLKHDPAAIAPFLREADKNEIKAMSGLDPELAVHWSVKASDETLFMCRPDGHPILIGGVGKTDGYGVPWMLGTPSLKKYSKSLTKYARLWVDRWTEEYGVLSNYVDARNKVHINWLTHLGFTVERKDEYIGYDRDVPFYPFYRSN